MVDVAKRAARGVFFSLAIAIVAMAMFSSVTSAYAADGADTKIRVDSANAAPGDTIQIAVSVENNPGILGGALELSYDEGLTLVKAVNGEAFSPLSMTRSGSLASPSRYVWDGTDIDAADVKDGEILVLTFEVADAVESGTVLNIVASEGGSFVNRNMESVAVAFTAGSVAITDFLNPHPTHKPR